MFSANASLLLSALGSAELRAVICGGGGGGNGGARFVEAVVCGDGNTLRLLTELLCSGDLADPAAAALIGAALCLALHRRPATVGPTRCCSPRHTTQDAIHVTGCH